MYIKVALVAILLNEGYMKNTANFRYGLLMIGTSLGCTLLTGSLFFSPSLENTSTRAVLVFLCVCIPLQTLFIYSTYIQFIKRKQG